MEYPNAGLISFRCQLDMWIPMLEQYWDHIVLEREKRQLSDDRRISIETDRGRIGLR
jgi:hypothetical protein